MVCLFYPFPVFSHFHKRLATFRIGFTQSLRIKPAGILKPPFLVIYADIKDTDRLFLPCFTHCLQIVLHLWEIIFQSACPLCSDWIDVNLYAADRNPVTIIKSIKQIVLTLIRGKLHCHIKVRTFTLQAPAPAPDYRHINNFRLNGIFINLCLHMAFYGFLNLCRVHFADLMEQLIRLCLEIFNYISLCLRFNAVCGFHLFHQSIIINRYQLILVTDVSPCTVIKGIVFQILHYVVKGFPDTDIRIVINTAVYLLIVCAHNGIVIAAVRFLYADEAVCYLKGKLCFRLFLRFCF